MDSQFSRYVRQMSVEGFGQTSQEKLSQSCAVIIGVGALGTVSSESLARAGVGKIVLIDRDYVELTNLQRQTIFTEDDAKNRTPKAVAAEKYLKKVNSQIEIVSKVCDVSSENIEEIVSETDVVIDGTDNLDTRMLINEACVKLSKPWIYAGALGSQGVTMNIVPGETACLRCMIAPVAQSGENCATHGVFGMLTGILALNQSMEAVKVLTGSKNLRKTLLSIDILTNENKQINVEKDDECAVCMHKSFEYLAKKKTGITTVKICSADLIQVTPAEKVEICLAKIGEKLKKIGKVKLNEHNILFENDSAEFTLFSDGRAMIKGAFDESSAKSVYTEFISG